MARTGMQLTAGDPRPHLLVRDRQCLNYWSRWHILQYERACGCSTAHIYDVLCPPSLHTALGLRHKVILHCSTYAFSAPRPLSPMHLLAYIRTCACLRALRLSTCCLPSFHACLAPYARARETPSLVCVVGGGVKEVDQVHLACMNRPTLHCLAACLAHALPA